MKKAPDGAEIGGFGVGTRTTLRHEPNVSWATGAHPQSAAGLTDAATDHSAAPGRSRSDEIQLVPRRRILTFEQANKEGRLATINPDYVAALIDFGHGLTEVCLAGGRCLTLGHPRAELEDVFFGCGE